MTATRCPPLHQRVSSPDKGPGLRLNLHPGQKKALASKARIVAVIAGGRSGKTATGPIWLWQEMRRRGPGDYLIAAPNYPLLDKAAAPEVEAFLGGLLQLGRLNRSPLQFVFSPAGCARLGWGKPDRQPRIIFSHATDPYSLEAFGAKAAWLDEAGMPGFRLASFEAVRQRLAIDQGRMLITTKPYCENWLRSHVYDRRDGVNIDVIQFGSAMNPAMPKEEIEEARRTLPDWKFQMAWLGEFSRPAGLIYDCFSPASHVVDWSRVPNSWERAGGLDFGGVNTAAVLLAKAPKSGIWYAIDEYHQGGLTSAQHVQALGRLALRGYDASGGEKPPRVGLWCGGSKSEDQWRREFHAGGMHVWGPSVSDVEVGIQRVYEMLIKGARNEPGGLKIFRRCANLIDELQSYSRVVDDAGEVVATEEIANKNDFHLNDSLRYIATRLVSGQRRGQGVPTSRERGGGIYGRGR